MTRVQPPATQRSGDLRRAARPAARGANTLVLVVLAAAAAFALRHFSTGDPAVGATASPLPSSLTVTAFGPAIVTADELQARARSAGYPADYPLYWAGEVTGTNIELTVMADGTWAVRYLPEGTKAGSPNDSLTVVTFYQPDGPSRVTSIAEEPTATSKTYSGGAIAASSAENPSEISFAYEGYPMLGVVTSPNPTAAWQLLDKGVIRPVD